MQEPSIILSERMDKLPSYLFGMLNALKNERRSMGYDIIDLGMGNPNDATPEPVIESLCNAARDHRTHRYPIADGMVSLKKELSKTYRERYGVHTDPAREIIITIGSKEGISHLCLAVCGPGDLVLVPSPYFPIHVYAPIIAGADVETFPLCPEEEMLRTLSDRCTSSMKRPKVLILNYPHNPTGATVERSFFSEIVRLAKKFGFIVVHDFAYSRLVYDGKSAPSFLEVPGASEVGVEFGSFSKTFNMAGWRIGYCAGNERLISALKRIKGYFDYGIFSAIQVAGITALRHCEADTRHQVSVYQERRDMLCDGLEKMGWDTPKPAGGMFVWSGIPDALLKGQDTLGFSLKLLNEANVVVSPGSGFGPEGEGYVRIALVENKQRIRQALRQIRRVL